MRITARLYAIVLFTMIATVAALGMLDLAHRWMTEGHGLNPFIAIPFGIFCAMSPFPFAHLLFKWIDYSKQKHPAY